MREDTIADIRNADPLTSFATFIRFHIAQPMHGNMRPAVWMSEVRRCHSHSAERRREIGAMVSSGAAAFLQQKDDEKETVTNTTETIQEHALQSMQRMRRKLEFGGEASE